MDFLAQCLTFISSTNGMATSLFLAGLVGGTTHCAAMCSPFIIAQTSTQSENGHDGLTLKKISQTMLIPYHLGRMTTYVALAIIVNSVINMAFLFSDYKILITVPLLMTAAIIFAISAFPNLAIIFPWAARISISPPFQWINKASKALTYNPGPFKRYLLGILLGFMPCGLVLSALMVSASANTIFDAAIAMSAFTIGTMPALFLIAFGANKIQERYPLIFKRISQGALAISAIWLFVLAGTLIIDF